MYKEALYEFEKIASILNSEELEVYANEVLAELEKEARIIMDSEFIELPYIEPDGTQSHRKTLRTTIINKPWYKNNNKNNDAKQDVKDFNAGKLRALVLSSAGGEGLSLGDTTRVNVLDPHFNPEKMNQIEARGIRSGGLKDLPEEERKVNVNRYIATMPEKKLLFLKWKDRMQTPDEVIYEIAKKKDNQNKILQDFLHETTMKKEL